MGSATVIMLALAAFALRIVWQIKVGFYASPETWEYAAIAQNVLAGDGFTFELFGTRWQTFGTPVYPSLLVALHWLSGGPGHYLAIGVAQAAFGSATVFATHAIARHIHPTASVPAATLVAAHPALIIYAAKVHEFSFEVLAATMLLLAALELDHRRSAKTVAPFTVWGALAALTRSTLLAVAFAHVALLALRRPLRPVVIAATLLLLATVPWTVRNMAVLGTVTFTAPYSCVIFWMGNNPNASGGTFARDGRGMLDAVPDEMMRRIAGRPELEQGRIFCAEAMEFVRAESVGWLRWYGQKLVWFWSFGPNAGILYPPGWIDLYRGGYALQVALAIGGAISILRSGSRRGLAFLLTMLAVVSLTQSIFYVEGRHRLLLEPMLAVLSAAGLVAIAGAGRSLRAWRRSGPAPGAR